MRIYRQKNGSVKIAVRKSDLNKNMAIRELEKFAKDVTPSTWYYDAYQWAQETANTLYYPIQTVVAVTALLSPLTEWELNKRRAIRVLESYNRGEKVSVHTKSTMAMVYSCLDGKDYKFGPKTGCFYHNILNPSDSNANVTVDSLAISILLGLGHVPGTYAMKENTLQIAQDIYREVAHKYGIAPSALQAATWEKSNRLRKDNRGLAVVVYDFCEKFSIAELNVFQMQQFVGN